MAAQDAFRMGIKPQKLSKDANDSCGCWLGETEAPAAILGDEPLSKPSAREPFGATAKKIGPIRERKRSDFTTGLIIYRRHIVAAGGSGDPLRVDYDHKRVAPRSFLFQASSGKKKKIAKSRDDRGA